jgi:hypothetical protein
VDITQIRGVIYIKNCSPNFAKHIENLCKKQHKLM